MAKRAGKFLLVLCLFILGIIIGGRYRVGSSNYFEEAKEEFEHEITDPSGNYEPIPLSPEGDLSSDVALRIDNAIEKIVGGIFRRLAGFLTD